MARDEAIPRLDDGTLGFLPERLNRDPAVLRGLTSDELWLALLVGALFGLLLGMPLAFVARALAVLPTAMIASMALTLFAGGDLLRRLRRGRPEAWLERQLQWVLAGHGAGRGHGLIRHVGTWSVRRSERHAGRGCP